MHMDRVDGVDQGRVAGGDDIEDVEPIAHEGARQGWLEQLLARGCVEELGRRLYRQHAVAPGGPRHELSGPHLTLAGVAVDRIYENVGVEREAPLNGHEVLPGRL